MFMTRVCYRVINLDHPFDDPEPCEVEDLKKGDYFILQDFPAQGAGFGRIGFGDSAPEDGNVVNLALGDPYEMGVEGLEPGHGQKSGISCTQVLVRRREDGWKYFREV